MTHHPAPASAERLTELVVHLSGAPGEAARGAVEDALERNGPWGDSLFNVADALLSVRGDETDERESEPSPA